MRIVVLELACLLLAAVSLRAAAAGSPWPTATPAPSTPSAEPASRPDAKPAPVTKEQALAIARKKLAETKPEASFEVLEKKTIEKRFGWVFFYQPRAAATDPKAVVPGAGPLVVHRADGSTTFLSSSVPPQVAIEEYEKAWARRKP
ncbi:MAG TPA: YrhB domain-containing protein [Vicinamibacteria bacterium]|nr:YrhB domain-containing protein [Vicinamibacteria bacterium]